MRHKRAQPEGRAEGLAGLSLGGRVMGVGNRFAGWCLFAALALIVAGPVLAAATAPATSPDGASLSHQRCATCHDNPDDSSRAPAKSALASRTPNEIFDILAHGAMAPMAEGLRDADLDAVALQVTRK